MFVGAREVVLKATFFYGPGVSSDVESKTLGPGDGAEGSAADFLRLESSKVVGLRHVLLDVDGSPH